MLSCKSRAECRVVVVTDSTLAAQHLDQMLWTFAQESFIPHRVLTSKGSVDFMEPVVITVGEIVVQGFHALVCDGTTPLDFAARYPEVVHFVLRDDPEKPLYNRALRGQYPPGSTFKPFMALAGLEVESIERIGDWWDKERLLELNRELASKVDELNKLNKILYHFKSNKSSGDVFRRVVELIVDIAQADPALVRAATSGEMDPASVHEIVPKRTCLEVALSELSLGRRNLPPEEGLALWKAQMDSGKTVG